MFSKIAVIILIAIPLILFSPEITSTSDLLYNRDLYLAKLIRRARILNIKTFKAEKYLEAKIEWEILKKEKSSNIKGLADNKKTKLSYMRITKKTNKRIMTSRYFKKEAEGVTKH